MTGNNSQKTYIYEFYFLIGFEWQWQKMLVDSESEAVIEVLDNTWREINPTKKFLVVFSKDWADEFQGEGFRVMTQNQLFLAKSEAEDLFRDNPGKDQEMGFGTNEAYYYDNFADYWAGFRTQPITDAEIATLNKITNGKDIEVYSFGIFPIYEL